MKEPVQIFLCVYWQKNDTPDRHVRYGEVKMHVGDLPDPPLTRREMQDIAFRTKMAFSFAMQARKYSRYRARYRAEAIAKIKQFKRKKKASKR